MKLQFDAKQPYQIDAVNAVVDLFDGQPLDQPDYATILQTFDTELFGSVAQTELGIGNRQSIDHETILRNLQAVQQRNDLDVDKELLPVNYSESSPAPLNFSVEMETGTGKTCVYLRTVFELSRKFGFKKFIVVVPSVAIREGVLKNLEITAEHFKALFNNLEYEYFVYDAKKANRLLIDGIKYEKLPDLEYSMRLFEEKEILSYLNNRLEVQKSVYDAVVYDSEVERKFAEALDKREDIKLFVKLPNWFQIDTPLGQYNPDWAILKSDDTVLYLVRETQSTKNFEKLRNSEAEKVRCGRRHFGAIGADYDVVTSADEV